MIDDILLIGKNNEYGQKSKNSLLNIIGKELVQRTNARMATDWDIIKNLM